MEREDPRIRDPVEWLDRDDPSATLRKAPALCLSGGGYRATLFHAGALWRLYETGHLARVERISSVSGGSIAAAQLGLRWTRLNFLPDASDFVREVVNPLRRLAAHTIDVPTVLRGLAFPDRISRWLERAYARHLFGRATLQHLPAKPHFVINASNVQSGALWRFMRSRMRDWRVGEVRSPRVALAAAVAASSAFPPFLSPYVLALSNEDFTPESGADLQRPPYTTRVVLTDGGVYDNLGLETVWKRYETVLASDAGGQLAAEPEPRTDWFRHAYRVTHLIDGQVRSLRKRQLIQSYLEAARKGAYWGIRADIRNYGLDDALPCPVDRTTELADLPTRLASLPEELQERLLNWGYAVADAALRRWVDPAVPAPAGFPYPGSGV